MVEIKYKTLTEVFLKKRNRHSYHFIISENFEISIKPEDFKARVMRILHYLQERGISPGDEVVFQIRDNYDFVCLFWACILGKIIPIPYNYLNTNREKVKLINIWRGLKNPYMVTERKCYESYCQYIQENNLSGIFENFEERTIFAEVMNQADENAEVFMPAEEDIAYVQFSSGSTSDPKGIVITHKNVMSSLKGTCKKVGINDEDIVLSWLPLTHNFGLVAAYLLPFVYDIKMIMMQPHLFVMNPVLWLKKLEEYHATITAAPNFGIKHVCKYMEFQKGFRLDLSSLRMIVNGSEPISFEVCKEFYRIMGPYGLKDTILFPAYGMAEATCAVTVPEQGSRVKEIHVLRNKLKIGDEIEEAKIENDNTISFVELGTNIGCEIKIVDSNGREVPERVVGIIRLRGDNISKRYYFNDEGTTNITDKEAWLNTGDVGFIREGKLIITGREKDIIFVNGENFYSHDIENMCYEVNEGDFTRVAICGIYSNEKKEDQVYCFVEYSSERVAFHKIAGKLKKHIVLKTGIGVTDVIPVKSMPLTHSGKVQRNMLLEMV